MRARSVTAALLLSLAPLAQADAIDVCVFDLIGSSGDAYHLMEEYAIDMRDEGLKFNLKPYTDEGVALSDFSGGECDALAATDIRVRRFNQFTGTLPAVGAIPSYEELETVLTVLSQPNAADFMDTDGYEIIGIFPLGAAYLFVTDRDINTASALAGKRIATLSYHRDAIHMVNYVNASVEPSDITDFGGKFNNRSVDAAYSPAWGYEALELYRGIGDEGGVIDYPLGQLTMQVVIRDGILDEDQAQRSREVAHGLMGEAMSIVRRHEQDIPEDHWVEIPEADIEDYQEMFRQNRLELRGGKDADGKEVRQVYDPEMLTLLRRVRCRVNPGAAECTAEDRE